MPYCTGKNIERSRGRANYYRVHLGIRYRTPAEVLHRL